MNSRTIRLLAAALLALPIAACGTSGTKDGEGGSAAAIGRPAPGAPATVVGTALDATTRKPLPGVRVEGPGGRTATTGEDGRFELRGLAAGSGGALTASLEDGRRAQVPLRPLAAGSRLEVVLHLRREISRR